ncbi:MAG: DUF3953 domain-containing protein [Candidatus Cloacimonadales bacterium]
MDYTAGIALLIFLAALYLIYLYMRHKYQIYPFNYKILFFMGIIYIVQGIFMKYYLFILLGIIFFIFGISNRKRWRRLDSWLQLSTRQRQLRIIIIIIFTLIFIYLSVANFWLK